MLLPLPSAGQESHLQSLSPLSASRFGSEMIIKSLHALPRDFKQRSRANSKHPSLGAARSRANSAHALGPGMSRSRARSSVRYEDHSPRLSKSLTPRLTKSHRMSRLATPRGSARDRKGSAASRPRGTGIVPAISRKSLHVEFPETVSPHQADISPTSRQVGGSPTSRQVGGSPTSRQAGGLPASHQAGGLPTARQAGGISTSHQVGGLPTSDQAGGLLASRHAGGLPTSHQVDGSPTSHQAGGLPTSHQAGGLPTSHQAGGLPTSNQAGGLPTSHLITKLGNTLVTPGAVVNVSRVHSRTIYCS